MARPRQFSVRLLLPLAGLETDADQKVGSLSDPKLAEYLQGLSPEARLSFLGQTTGAFGDRTLKTINAGKMSLSAGTAPETTIVGETPKSPGAPSDPAQEQSPASTRAQLLGRLDEIREQLGEAEARLGRVLNPPAPDEEHVALLPFFFRGLTPYVRPYQPAEEGAAEGAQSLRQLNAGAQLAVANFSREIAPGTEFLTLTSHVVNALGALQGALGAIQRLQTAISASTFDAQIAARAASAAERFQTSAATRGITNMARKVDIKQIDRIVRQVGLTPGQRELLHEELQALKGAGGLVNIKDLLELAQEIKASFPRK